MHRIALISLTAVAALAASVGVADAAVASSSHSIGAQALNKGVYSIDEFVVNHTSQDWTLDSSTRTTGLGQHWAERPLDVLHPGESEHISSYTDNPISDMGIRLDYRLPNGEHVTSMMMNGPLGPSSAWAGVFKDMAPASRPGLPDDKFRICTSVGSGGHANYQFDVDNIPA
jgi:hypothetical protein